MEMSGSPRVDHLVVLSSIITPHYPPPPPPFNKSNVKPGAILIELGIPRVYGPPSSAYIPLQLEEWWWWWGGGVDGILIDQRVVGVGLHLSRGMSRLMPGQIDDRDVCWSPPSGGGSWILQQDLGRSDSLEYQQLQAAD